MPALNPTSPDLMVDAAGRPHFLWDMDMTLAACVARLTDPDPDLRSYFIGKRMRQAKPDDVFTFVSRQAIREQWPRIERHLGHSREFWQWLFTSWERLGHFKP